MGFIAGAYDVSYNNSSVGKIADGVTVEHFVNKQLITGDNYASTPQDAVYQGMEVFVEFTMMEYDNSYALDAFWPYHATFGNIGNIGALDSSYWKVLLLNHATLGTGTPAATQPTSFTADRAVLAEGYPVRLLYAPALRDVPIRLRLYPNASGEFFALVSS